MKKLFFFVIVAALLTSCAPKIPFTQAVREQYQLSDEELKSIQFYTSGDIVLQNSSQGKSGKETQEGELVITSGSSLDQVIIKEGTPGVVDKVIDKNKVAVTFEDGKFLVFGDPQDRKGTYNMLAGEWQGNKGKLKYGEKVYYTTSASSNVHIKFKMRKLHKFRREQRVVKGKKL